MKASFVGSTATREGNTLSNTGDVSPASGSSLTNFGSGISTRRKNVF